MARSDWRDLGVNNHLDALYYQIVDKPKKKPFEKKFKRNDIIISKKNKKIFEVAGCTGAYVSFKTGGEGLVSNYRKATKGEKSAYKQGFRYLEDYKKTMFYEVYE